MLFFKEKALRTRLNFLALFFYLPITHKNSSHRHISSIKLEFNFQYEGPLFCSWLLREISMNVLPYYSFLLNHIVNT